MFGCHPTAKTPLLIQDVCGGGLSIQQHCQRKNRRQARFCVSSVSVRINLINTTFLHGHLRRWTLSPRQSRDYSPWKTRCWNFKEPKVKIGLWKNNVLVSTKEKLNPVIPLVEILTANDVFVCFFMAESNRFFGLTALPCVKPLNIPYETTNGILTPIKAVNSQIK